MEKQTVSFSMISLSRFALFAPQPVCPKIGSFIWYGLTFRNENANNHYTTEFITNLFSEEGKGVFTTRQNVLGHMQQGGNPSPFDRNYGTKIAARAVSLLNQQVDASTTPEGKLSRVMRKPVFGLSDHVRHKQVCLATDST